MKTKLRQAEKQNTVPFSAGVTTAARTMHAPSPDSAIIIEKKMKGATSAICPYTCGPSTLPMTGRTATCTITRSPLAKAMVAAPRESVFKSRNFAQVSAQK